MRPVAHPHPLGPRAEALETLRLAGPLALANVLQMLTYAVDVIFIARLGTQELAASSLVVAMFSTALWSLHSMCGAVAPVIAAELGARAPALRAVRRAVRMALWLAMLSGVLAMVLFTQAHHLLRATGQEAALIQLAAPFMAVLLWSVVPMLLAGVLRNFVSALGRPVFATVITALSIGTNALGNYALVFGNLGAPAMGLEGSALSTVLSSLFVLVAYVLAIRLDPRLHRYRVFGHCWRPDWARLGQLVRVGGPIALTVLAEASVFGTAAFLMGRIGADELAAHSLALQLASFAFMVPQGVAQATAIRVGYYFGAREPVGVGRAGWAGIGMGTGFMVLTALAMLLAPHTLLALYIDPAAPANAQLVALASQYLLVAAAFQLFDGVQVSTAGALRGLQDTQVPMWISILSYWTVGFTLAAGLGLATPLEGFGVWLGLAAGLVVVACLLLWRWHGRERLALV